MWCSNVFEAKVAACGCQPGIWTLAFIQHSRKGWRKRGMAARAVTTWRKIRGLGNGLANKPVSARGRWGKEGRKEEFKEKAEGVREMGEKLGNLVNTIAWNNWEEMGQKGQWRGYGRRWMSIVELAGLCGKQKAGSPGNRLLSIC